jgi:hypothetical protein
VYGKKVVIEKINQHTPVKTERFVQPPLAPKKMRVLVCKGINFPVQQNSPFNTGRETPVQPPFDKIPHEISNKEL